MHGHRSSKVKALFVFLSRRNSFPEKFLSDRFSTSKTPKQINNLLVTCSSVLPLFHVCSLQLLECMALGIS